MFGDPIARLARNGLDELIEIVALKERSSSALTAKQKMLVTLGRRDESLASLRLVNALDQAKFFQLFQRAINGDQSESGILLTRRIIHLDGSQGAVTIGDDLNDGAARVRQPITVILQLSEPVFDCHR
jgi:hypothetical protein